MIVVFRIVKSEDCGDTVRLTLAQNGLEDPKTNAVVLETDNLPYTRKKTFDYNHALAKLHPQPVVMVNGVEMWLVSLQTRAVFEAYRENVLAAAGQRTWWAIGSSEPATFLTATDETIMVVAWDKCSESS